MVQFLSKMEQFLTRHLHLLKEMLRYVHGTYE